MPIRESEKAPMSTKASILVSSSSRSLSEEMEGTGHEVNTDVSSVVDSLKILVTVERVSLLKAKMKENKEKLQVITDHIYNLSSYRTDSCVSNRADFLTKRQEDAVCMLTGLNVIDAEQENCISQEDDLQSSSAILLGSSSSGKNVIRPIKLHEVQKLPPYTTWIFLDRNQRMTEDQSVVGRRRIYYDQDGGEALICSDSEEEIIDEEEEKKDFTESEDYIIRMTIRKIGLSELVLDLLANMFERNPSDIKSCESTLNILYRQGTIVFWVEEKLAQQKKMCQPKAYFLIKILMQPWILLITYFAEDVFDCRLHGCSQDLVFPVEKQSPWSSPDDDKSMPCGVHCYRVVSSQEAILSCYAGKNAKSHQSETASSNAKCISESSESEMLPYHNFSPSETNKSTKHGYCKKNIKNDTEKVSICTKKRRKKVPPPPDMDCCGNEPRICPCETDAAPIDKSSSLQEKNASFSSRKTRRKESDMQSSGDADLGKALLVARESCIDRHNVSLKELSDENTSSNMLNPDKQWRTFEKSLFIKGLEIFGRNSCLIARNLLNGIKTCTEVFQYMKLAETGWLGTGDTSNLLLTDNGKLQHKGSLIAKLHASSRFVRRRGRIRRLKYTWKSVGHHSIRKRITEKKDQPCRQFTPCGCQSACRKQCSCILNGTCCEKYCGCPKRCKNRFRGCHCAKSQCRSRQCPCFAADRECDPDVCRNCWVSCGDGTLGSPSQRGDNYECRNMKLLLKQQQRVLLGKSDVSGWGAFLRNSVNKHEYLGEYTGELISHHEADKRGKIYDRENSSFLFNLNDQFVLDAYRKGDKLKFANHSPDPNCYAKVIMVAGDHRVGIFAKERIGAGEELFYDYRYEPDRAPAWARKPEVSGSKKDEGPSSSGRAKKLA